MLYRVKIQRGEDTLKELGFQINENGYLMTNDGSAEILDSVIIRHLVETLLGINFTNSYRINDDDLGTFSRGLHAITNKYLSQGERGEVRTYLKGLAAKIEIQTRNPAQHVPKETYEMAEADKNEIELNTQWRHAVKLEGTYNKIVARLTEEAVHQGMYWVAWNKFDEELSSDAAHHFSPLFVALTHISTEFKDESNEFFRALAWPNDVRFKMNRQGNSVKNFSVKVTGPSYQAATWPISKIVGFALSVALIASGLDFAEFGVSDLTEHSGLTMLALMPLWFGASFLTSTFYLAAAIETMAVNHAPNMFVWLHGVRLGSAEGAALMSVGTKLREVRRQQGLMAELQAHNDYNREVYRARFDRTKGRILSFFRPAEETTTVENAQHLAESINDLIPSPAEQGRLSLRETLTEAVNNRSVNLDLVAHSIVNGVSDKKVLSTPERIKQWVLMNLGIDTHSAAVISLKAGALSGDDLMTMANNALTLHRRVVFFVGDRTQLPLAFKVWLNDHQSSVSVVETELYDDAGALSMAKMEEKTPVWAVSVTPYAPEGVEINDDRVMNPEFKRAAVRSLGLLLSLERVFELIRLIAQYA